MMTKAVVNRQPIWPVRFVAGIGRGVVGVLGPLLTKGFWTKIVVACAEEMVSAFLIALGMKFVSHGKLKGDPEVKKAAQCGAGGSNAFNGGFTQRPEFSSGYPQYTSNPQFNRGSQTFQGF